LFFKLKLNELLKWINNDFFEGDYENDLKNGIGVNIFKLIFFDEYIIE